MLRFIRNIMRFLPLTVAFGWRKIKRAYRLPMAETFQCIGQNWRTGEHLPIAVFWGIPRARRVEISGFLSDHRVMFILGNPSLRQLKPHLDAMPQPAFWLARKDVRASVIRYAGKRGLAVRWCRPSHLPFLADNLLFHGELQKPDALGENGLVHYLRHFDTARHQDAVTRARSLSAEWRAVGRLPDEKNSVFDRYSLKRVVVVVHSLYRAGVAARSSLLEERVTELLALATAEHPDARCYFIAPTRAYEQAAVAARKANLFVVSSLEEVERLIRNADRLYTYDADEGVYALLHDVPVTVTGRPFFAGWGLTDDRDTTIQHGRQMDFATLFAACYLQAGSYYCPLTGKALTAELAMEACLLRGTGGIDRPFWPKFHAWRAWNEAGIAAGDAAVVRRLLFGRGGHISYPRFTELLPYSAAVPLEQRGAVIAHLLYAADKTGDAFEAVLAPLSPEERVRLASAVFDQLAAYGLRENSVLQHWLARLYAMLSEDIAFFCREAATYEPQHDMVKPWFHALALVSGDLPEPSPLAVESLMLAAPLMFELAQLPLFEQRLIGELQRRLSPRSLADWRDICSAINGWAWLEKKIELWGLYPDSEEVTRIGARLLEEARRPGPFSDVRARALLGIGGLYTRLERYGEVPPLLKAIRRTADIVQYSHYYRQFRRMFANAGQDVGSLPSPCLHLLGYSRLLTRRLPIVKDTRFQRLQQRKLPFASEIKAAVQTATSLRKHKRYIQALSRLRNLPPAAKEQMEVHFARAQVQQSANDAAAAESYRLAMVTAALRILGGDSGNAMTIYDRSWELMYAARFHARTQQLLGEGNRSDGSRRLVMIASGSNELIAQAGPSMHLLAKQGVMVGCIFSHRIRLSVQDAPPWVKKAHAALDAETYCDFEAIYPMSEMNDFYDIPPMRKGVIRHDVLHYDWQIDWDNREVIVEGMNAYQGFYERLNNKFRQYRIEVDEPQAFRLLLSFLFKTDKLLHWCRYVHSHAAAYGYEVRLVAGEPHIAPYHILRVYCDTQEPKGVMQIVYPNIAYQNLFNPELQKQATAITLDNVTLYRHIPRIPCLPPHDLFHQWRAGDRTKELALVDQWLEGRKQRNTPPESEAREAVERIRAWRDKGGKVVALLGRLPTDLGLPFDGGMGHSDMCDWLNHSIQTVADSNTLLLLKPHPHEINPSIARRIREQLKDLVEVPWNANCMLLGHHWINTLELIGLVDAVSLWSGSAALELSAYQVPVIVSSYFGETDFPVPLAYPRDREHYAELLHHPERLKVTDDVARLSKEYLAYMGSADASIPYDYANIRATNDPIGQLRWNEKALDRLQREGDPYMAMLAERYFGPMRSGFLQQPLLAERYRQQARRIAASFGPLDPTRD